MKLRAAYMVQIGEQGIALRPTLRAASYLMRDTMAFNLWRMTLALVTLALLLI